MTHPIKSPKKLIEVALPLDAINAASAREKSIRQGHPSTLHLWWARRPLAAARAVIFAQLVNDPGYQQGGGFKYGKNKKEAAIERKRLFGILEELVKWENTTNEEVLERARAEIRRSWREVCELNRDHPDAKTLFDPDKMPGLHDPFAGGGAIPLEAQRLGLEAFASDLNPVAVLINKAMIEIPPKFAGQPPVHPEARASAGMRAWKGAEGLAEDVRRYGAWIREEADKRIGHLYPKVTITREMAAGRPDLRGLEDQELTVIAWLWARTVRSPHPAFSTVHVPLASTYVLSEKPGNTAYVEVAIQSGGYEFAVRAGDPPIEASQGARGGGKRAGFRCVMSGAPIGVDYVKAEAMAGRLGQRLMAIVAAGPRGRIFLDPEGSHEQRGIATYPAWRPDLRYIEDSRAFTPHQYGLGNWGSLFTSRQTMAISTFLNLAAECVDSVRAAAVETRPPDLADAYARTVTTYLALGVSKAADLSSTLCHWQPNAQHLKIAPTYTRNALAMTWDFAEANPFSDSSGNFMRPFELMAEVIARLGAGVRVGSVEQLDARSIGANPERRFISTDPPYYGNVPYADMSDFFYVWLRKALEGVYPELFSTIATPKRGELVASPVRQGSKDGADAYFLAGMEEVFAGFTSVAHPSAPATIYYAFKQAETEGGSGTSSRGWIAFLEALFRSGFSLSGTWPVRTERPGRMRDNGSNALASSIVLVCRKRPADAATISRRDFLRELNVVLPEALDEMTKGSGEDRSPVAPVDLSQAIIGPGMAVFSKYAAVLEADGSPMSVKTALQLINRFLAEDDFDRDTQFCLQWFEQHGWDEAAFGEADVLARAKATSVAGLVEADVVASSAGKVRLLRPGEYPADWDPLTDTRNPVWEAMHQLIRALRADGESGAGRLLAGVRGKSEAIRQLAYRLYTLCERRGWAEDARAYNELVASWSSIEAAAGEVPTQEGQLDLFGGKS